MFQNLTLQPKYPQPVGSGAASGAAPETAPETEPHITVIDPLPQPGSAPASENAFSVLEITPAFFPTLSGSPWPSLSGPPESANPTTNTNDTEIINSCTNNLRLDLIDSELLTPGALTSPDSPAGGNSNSSHHEREHEIYNNKGDWYSSSSLLAKSASKHTASCNNNKSTLKRGSRSGSGAGAFSRSARITKISCERNSARQALPSGVTKRSASVPRRNGHGQGQKRHRHKSLSTNGKLDSISVSTWEAFSNLTLESNAGKSTNGGEINNSPDLSHEVVWGALSCIPSFSFPPLQHFLTEHHAWLPPNTAGARPGHGAGDTMYDADDRIHSLNTEMPLGHRTQMLDRLASVLASPPIKRNCGNDVARKRLPIFIRLALEELRRICTTEAAAADRQLTFLRDNIAQPSGSFCSRPPTPEPHAVSLGRVLARRFNMGAVPYAISPVDLTIMSDNAPTLASTNKAIVDGSTLVMVVHDLMSILSSARRLFERKDAVVYTPRGRDRAASREQRNVYRSFDMANSTKQRLQDVQRLLNDFEATANGGFTVDDDLAGSFQAAFDVME